MAQDDTPIGPPKPKVAKRAPWHELAVAAFVAQTRVDDVAAALGLGRRTITRWKGVPGNWEEVTRARSQVLESTLSRLRNSMPQLADRLVAVANNPATEPPVVVRAIQVVFEQFSGLSQRTEFELRLTRIEEAVRGSASSPGVQTSRRLSLLTAPAVPTEATPGT